MRACWMLVLAGCGRYGFEPQVDAAPPSGVANIAFVTSTTTTGNIGGVAGADALCETRAAAAGLTGTFIAWISPARFSQLVGSRGWRLVDGTPVADLPDDFVTRSVLHPISEDETGADLRAATPPTYWTGLNVDGTAVANCQAWTSSQAPDSAVYGDTRGIAEEVSLVNGTTCDQQERLACLEIGQATPVSIARRRGRYAFVTAQVWLPDPAGIASADQLCALEASRAGLPGTYLAVLAPGTGSASSRFDLSGPPWIRVDGALLAPTAGAMFATPFLDNAIDRTAGGVAVADGTRVWAGDPMTAPTTPVCGNWTSHAAGDSALAGDTLSTSHNLFYAYSPFNCAHGDVHILCFEQ